MSSLATSTASWGAHEGKRAPNYNHLRHFLMGADLDSTNYNLRFKHPITYAFVNSETDTLVTIDHDYNGVGLLLDTEGTTADSFQWQAATTTGVVGDWDFDAVTTGTGISINMDGLTSGVALHVVSDSASTTERSLVLFENDNTASVSTTVLELQQDADEPPLALTGAGTFTQTTVGSAGGGTALPATPTGYIQVQLQGTDVIVPYYDIA